MALRRIFFYLSIILLTACSSPPDEALKMGLANAPSTLDPRLATDATSERINRLLYQGLVDFDADGRPVPSLAGWERQRPTHYRFTLNKDRRDFHHGSRLTARDVQATFEFILDPVNASPHRTALSVIERIETPNSEQIDFYLSRPAPLFPSYLGIGIVPADLAAASHPFNDRPVGSGPFRFVDWPVQGQLILQRLADDRRFEFLQVKDPNVRVMKLLRGEIDMTQNDLPPELLDYLADRKEIRVARGPGTNFSYLGFNLEEAVTGKLLVRRAIAHAIDREAIIEYLMQGGARPAQALFPPDHWAGGRELMPYNFDPEQAKSLLQQAGFDAQRPLELVYKTSSDPFRIRMATIIQSQLAQVGIRTEVRSYDWGTFFGDVKAGRFQLYGLTWVGIKTPDIFRYVFHSESLPPGGANRGRYRSTRADELIETAEKTVDPGLQAPIYRELQALLLEELPYIPLWYEDQVFACRADIRGYEIAADGNYDGLLKVERGGESTR